MRLIRWLILPLLLLGACHWKGDGNDEFIRDPFAKRVTDAQTGTGRPRDFGVPKQLVPRGDGRADMQMTAAHGLTAEAKGKDVFDEPSTPVAPRKAEGRRP